MQHVNSQRSTPARSPTLERIQRPERNTMLTAQERELAGERAIRTFDVLVRVAMGTVVGGAALCAWVLMR